jgi:hypothetical protein
MYSSFSTSRAKTSERHMTTGWFLVFGLMFLASATRSQPSDSLPAPTGPSQNRTNELYWKDGSRDELETKTPEDKRELMVHLFYPADANASGERAKYIPDADTMRGDWNEDKLARAAAIRAFSLENPPMLPGSERFPVAIFLPGGGVKALCYHIFFEDLASHGWAVAVIDPPYNARAVRFPDGRVLGNLPPEERGWPRTQNRDDNLRYYQENIVHWCRDVSFVIDQLTALDGGAGPFARRLDLKRGVGVLGHSRGGQAAGTVRMLDERVRGGINLDGLVFGNSFQAVKGDGVGGLPPFLWLGKRLPPPPTEEQLQRARRTREQYEEEEKRLIARWDRTLGAVTGGALRVHLDRPGIEHIDFSDEPFWNGSITPESRPGKLRTAVDTRAWVRAFLDGSVRGEWAELKRLASEANTVQTGVIAKSFGKMWP